LVKLEGGGVKVPGIRVWMVIMIIIVVVVRRSGWR